MQPEHPPSTYSLRDFIRTECGEQVTGMPVGMLIRECYRELLLQARAPAPERLSPNLIQQRLREIAHDFMRTGRDA
ncbi:MAG TPA: hypothetical protein PKX48_06090 [Planctomycetota bacterium]|jgi:hypothetical protein|nr:hypothetical protein [Planctomycetota bacterium]OQC19844.1 MAG: hypothetical protein BWX69_02333 [Planctomycetes bacterium ADurb.Bin069]NMD36393.1 hypothetical protein [Planctomycetota bacterium]HNR99458.1 hypothetical protein [Planctomycetota bacterium]HNU26353.1 hypothetical protein [Planctomycetota bacterium]